MPTNNPYPDLYDCRGLQIMYRDSANQLVTLPEFCSRDGLCYLIYVVENLEDVTECLIPVHISDLTAEGSVMMAFDSEGQIVTDGWLRTSLLMRICSVAGDTMSRKWKVRHLSENGGAWPIVYELTVEQVNELLGPSTEYWREQGVSIDTSDMGRPALSIFLPKTVQNPVDPARCFALHTYTMPEQTDMFRRLLAGFMDCAFSLTGKSIPVEYEPGTYPEGAAAKGAEILTPETLAAAGIDPLSFPAEDEADLLYDQSYRKFPDGYIYNYLSPEYVRNRIEYKTTSVLRDENGKIEMLAINKHRRQGFGFIEYLVRVPDSKRRHLGKEMIELLMKYARIRGWKYIALCHDSMSPFHDRYYRSLGFNDAPEFNCITSYVRH